MSKITATSFAPCQNTVLFGQFNIGNWSHNRENWNHVKLKKKKKKKQQLQYLATKSEKRSRPLVVEDQTEPDYYSSRTFADIPLYESPWALFDHYLEDKSRVFKAMFPDEQRSKRLNEVLRRLEKEMEDKVNGRLLADYGKFKKERFIHSWIWRISKLWNGKRR
ncbi:Protein of unknown function (DUF1997) [Melia azedarach]|uniref:Uncharacterized protein n=2 Tax=Melia azedarach TaxID=155640 RepID=A0ACC1X9Q1_MELAZ|nr:Protein of unknown function (DUF1997) [Melia azedarach]KAJ4707408.1 Protein of unknown function (DUF1997) [Melia azedarach]